MCAVSGYAGGAALAVGQTKRGLKRNRLLDARVPHPAAHDHTGTRGPPWGTFSATQGACGVLGQCQWCLSAISAASTDLRGRPPISRPTSPCMPPRPPRALAPAPLGWLRQSVSPQPLALSSRRARHRHGARRAGRARGESAGCGPAATESATERKRAAGACSFIHTRYVVRCPAIPIRGRLRLRPDGGGIAMAATAFREEHPGDGEG